VGGELTTTDGPGVLVGELVEQHPRGLVVVEHDDDPDARLSESAWARVIAATPPTTARAYARLLRGVTDPTTDTPSTRPAGRPVDDEDPDAGALRAWSRMAWIPWCAAQGRRSGIDGTAAAPETLAQWANDLADIGVGAPSIEQGLAAVARLHREHGHRGQPDPDRALSVLKTYRKNEGKHRKRRKAPVTIPLLRAMLDHTDTDTVKGRRDAAILVVGVAGMFRRSELVAFTLDDVAEEPDGLELYVGKSKTDQAAEGATVVIPRSRHKGSRSDSASLVRAVRQDLAAQGIHDGALFRAVSKSGRYAGALHPGGYDVVRVIKAAAYRAGMASDTFAGHSLRAGGATAAHLAGASIPEIMEQGRWTNPAQVMEYIRLLDRWKQNAAARMDL
jgi:integrase